MIHIKPFFDTAPAESDDKTQHKESMLGASIIVPNLDISIDMLKRIISKDPFSVKQLGLSMTKTPYDAFLGNVTPFILGTASDGNEFAPFDFTASLKQAGLANGDVIYCKSDI